MKKAEVQIGTTCIVKVSGVLTRVRITGQSPYGGWVGRNLATGREVRIRSTARPSASPEKPTKRKDSPIMRLFAVDNENAVTAFPAAEQIPEGQEQFASEKELAKLAANWPTDRLVQIWNSFAGVAGPFADLKPVKKFTDRKTAVKRIWAAIQKLDTPEAQETAPAAPQAADVAPKKANATKAAKAKDGASVPHEFSKKAIVLEMLRRKDGATLAEISKATDWQNHSIRGFISGSIAKRMGLKVESTKDDLGNRRYHVIS
jgi:hypothetical protein